jgi:uncharacterized protein YycO
MSVKILAISNYSLGALIIKIFTFSKWNHVAICFNDEFVIDSTLSTGVHLTPFLVYKNKYKHFEEIIVNVPDEDAAKDFALRQLGKKYDWTALFGIVFQQRKWEKPNKWFCSELVEAVLAAGGKRRWREIAGLSILPRETYAVGV